MLYFQWENCKYKIFPNFEKRVLILRKSLVFSSVFLRIDYKNNFEYKIVLFTIKAIM